MADPIRADLSYDRGTLFHRKFWRVGVDWTGSTFRMQVRKVPDAVSTPYWTLDAAAGLTLTYAGSRSVAAHIAAGTLPPAIKDQVNPATGVKYADADVVTVSQLEIYVDTAFPSSFPYLSDHEKPVPFYYDIMRDPSGGGAVDLVKEFYGTFLVKPTVTWP